MSWRQVLIWQLVGSSFEPFKGTKKQATWLQWLAQRALPEQPPCPWSEWNVIVIRQASEKMSWMCLVRGARAPTCSVRAGRSGIQRLRGI